MQKITYLDGIRGLAALMVVFHHFILAFLPAFFFGENAVSHLPGEIEVFSSGSFINLLYNGNFGVCIFFVLSGFVLSWKFFVTKKNEVVFASACKRYFRLVLPVAFSILLAYFMMKTNLFRNVWASEMVGSGWLGAFWNFVPNVQDALSQAFYGNIFLNLYSYNTVLWTISFEFFGAFLIYAFLLLLGRNNYRWLGYLALSVYFFQTYYLAFILGMLLSDMTANNGLLLPKLDKTKFIRWLVVLFGLFIGSHPSGRSTDGTMYAWLHVAPWDTLPQIYHVLGAFLVLWVLLSSKRMQNIFSNKYLLILGDLSFAIYVLHFIVLGSFASWMFASLLQFMPYLGAFGLTLSVSTALILMISWLMHVSVERFSFELSQCIYEKILLRLWQIIFFWRKKPALAQQEVEK